MSETVPEHESEPLTETVPEPGPSPVLEPVPELESETVPELMNMRVTLQSCTSNYWKAQKMEARKHRIPNEGQSLMPSFDRLAEALDS